MFWQCVSGLFTSCPPQRKFRTNCTRSWKRFWVRIQFPWTRSLSSGEISGPDCNPSDHLSQIRLLPLIQETVTDKKKHRLGEKLPPGMLGVTLSHFCPRTDTASRSSTRQWGPPSWPLSRLGFRKWRAKSINTSSPKRYLLSCCPPVHFSAAHHYYCQTVPQVSCTQTYKQRLSIIWIPSKLWNMLYMCLYV